MMAQPGSNRGWLAASVLAALSYWFVRDAALPAALLIAWKGSGVALLAAFALAAQHRQIAGVLALGALGDMLIEFKLELGAAAFLAGHLIAIHLYWHRRRTQISVSQQSAAWAMVLLIPAIAWLLTHSVPAAVYALALGSMAASAWLSIFPRYRTGIGAVLFAVSDLLIFARLDPLANSALPDLLIWPLYYAGQMLICVGVCAALNASKNATT